MCHLGVSLLLNSQTYIFLAAGIFELRPKTHRIYLFALIEYLQVEYNVRVLHVNIKLHSLIHLLFR